MADHLLFEFTMVTSDHVDLPVGAKITTYYDDVNDLISVYKDGALWYAPGMHIGKIAGSVKTFPPPPVPPPPPPRSYKVTGGSRGKSLDDFATMVYFSVFTYCRGGDYLEFTTNAVTIANTAWPFAAIQERLLSPLCCDINSLDFEINTTHATVLTPTPNGKITITNGVEDITLFEAILDNTLPYVAGAAGKIEFTNVAPGPHTVAIRRIGTSCFFTVAIEVNDISEVPQMQIQLMQEPAQFSAVYQPILYKWKFLNGNTLTLVAASSGIYSRISIGNFEDPRRAYFLKHKKVRIVDSGAYTGTWDVLGTDGPTQLLIKVPFSGNMNVSYVPFEKIEFDLFAEAGAGFSSYQKIARLNAAADDTGTYTVRVEGYLQSVFQLQPPAQGGNEITLSRKYYMEPIVSSVYLNNNGGFKTAIYSTLKDITPYLEELIPLGPGPLNFINEQSNRGMPVLFSILDTVEGRVRNIITESQEDLLTSSPIVNVASVPMSTHYVRWLHSGNIANLNTTPALPDWITILPGPANEVNLKIESFTATGGDYESADYNDDDYLTFGINSVVGCYTYTFKDGATTLFVLNICIYPVQQVNKVCVDEAVNIAWVNVHGGWSSYLFGKGKKTKGIEIGNVTDYKSKGILKRSSVEDVYDTVTVSYVNLSMTELQFIASLRYAIQAYLFNDNTNQWDIPIYIDKSNAPLFSLPFRQIETSGSITFKLAEEIQVQRQ